ncbi:hypothetical protein RQP46_001338 [Phenoliferia psychrophenolica]
MALLIKGLLALTAFTSATLASRVELAPRQATSTNSSATEYLPPILIPQAGVLWTAGSNYTVSWNATLPANVTTAEATQAGTVMLGYVTQNPFSQNLATVLATPNFYALSTYGYVNITLPANLTPRSTYIIALIGKSTRVVSQQFQIQAALPVTSTSTRASSTGSSTASGSASLASGSSSASSLKSAGSRTAAGGLMMGVAVAVAALA